MYKVTIKNGENVICFTFDEPYLADAMKFMQDGMETCEVGTEFTIVEIKEEG